MQDRRVRFFYRLKILFVRDNDRCAVQITINVAPLFERGRIGRNAVKESDHMRTFPMQIGQIGQISAAILKSGRPFFIPLGTRQAALVRPNFGEALGRSKKCQNFAIPAAERQFPRPAET